MSDSISKFLARSNKNVLTIYIVFVSFTAYFCTYAFRKPFTAATFDEMIFFNLSYKTLLITAQVLGYTLSKFLGIKFISELKKNNREAFVIILILVAEISLALFALIPPPFNAVCLFMNGLPLGMVWGAIFNYLEGRKVSEILGAGLSASFIVSSGVLKSLGSYFLMKYNVSEFWMPFWVGLIFLPIMLLSVYLMSKIPAPTIEDEEHRSERIPMNSDERKKILIRFALGIFLLTGAYILFTAYRDLRDNFAVEIWNGLDRKYDSLIFARTEIPVALIILVVMGSTMLIKNNLVAFRVNHIIILAGTFIIGGGTLLFQMKLLSPVIWMTFMGIGLYMSYVPFNCILFDRMIALLKIKGNAGYLIYIADSCGYLGSVGFLIYKNLGLSDVSWYSFFVNGAYFVMLIGGVLIIGSYIYFTQVYRQSGYHKEDKQIILT